MLGNAKVTVWGFFHAIIYVCHTMSEKRDLTVVRDTLQ
jgi:hypothetical protein